MALLGLEVYSPLNFLFEFGCNYYIFLKMELYSDLVMHHVDTNQFDEMTSFQCHISQAVILVTKEMQVKSVVNL